MAKQQTKNNKPIKEPTKPATPADTTPTPAPVQKPSVVPLFGRSTDVILSGLYCALGVSSLFALFAGCKGQGPKHHPLVAPACDYVAHISLATPLELRALWYKDVYASAHSANEFLHFAYCLNNIIFALPLSLVMIVGAKGNAFQKQAIMHGSIHLLLSAFYFAVGSAAVAEKQHVFDAAYMAQIVVPLLFLHRWWGENVFSAASLKCSGFLCAITHFFVVLAVLSGLGFVLVTVYEWAIDSHKDFKGYQRVSPHFEVYTKVAAGHAKDAGEQLNAKLQELGKTVIEQVNALTQK
eukprot:TRINITY_DN1520_c0_g1_i1.p1 TRINITY_DN1520_c0_g1~~TRINITY_DN1520_c0_g1_i1.p1  ORF type:complete len:295 (+),score=91.83 TRINITY_DN1520_c0_g1_i1:56-940(+)